MACLKPPAALGPLEWEVRQAEIDAYAALCGANDPIHVDVAYARTTPLGGTIAQGLLVMGRLAELMSQGPWGPDAWSAEARMEVRFRRPVYPGETLRLIAERRCDQDADGALAYRVACLLQDGQAAVDGTAWVRDR